MSEYKPLRSSAPAHSLLSPAFRYTPADRTDIRERFARIREAQALAREALNAASNVKRIKREKP